jgi:hypothetical protein
MARKTTSKASQPDADGVIERMEYSLSIPPSPAEPRPGSAVSLEMVNVFGEPVAEGVRLRLTAWVNNLSYVKHVWVDAYLTDAKAAVVHSETLLLDYYEGAGGGGDFFILDTAIPGVKPAVAILQYRLYYNIGATVYTDGILHTHALGTPKAPAKSTAGTRSRKASKAAAKIATAGAAAAAAAGAAKLVTKTPAKPKATPAAKTPAAKTPAAKAMAAARMAAKKTVAKVTPAKADAPAKPAAPAKRATKRSGSS